MELVTIFVNKDTNEGLYAVRYEEGALDEWERIFDNWNNTNFVISYLITNEEALQDDYFQHYTIDDLVTKVHEEADKLIADFVRETNIDMETLFKPLDPKHINFDANDVLQKAKAVIDDNENYPQPILRVYAIRLTEKTFIITGGAIKLTHFMESHHDTRDELQKLEKVRQWLLENGIDTQDDLNYCYE